MLTSRARLTEYVKMFGVVDEMRIEQLNKLINVMQTNKLVNEIEKDIEGLNLLNEIAECIINAFMENGELNGN